MYIPEDLSVYLIFTLVSTLFLGSWANAIKLTPNTRFELFYYDFSIGIFVFTFMMAIVLGGNIVNTSGSGGGAQTKDFPRCLSTLDNLHVVYALSAGALFNFANFLLIAAIKIMGMTVAFPTGMGISLVVATFSNFFLGYETTNKPGFLFGGLGVSGIAILCNSYAFKYRRSEEIEQNIKDPLNESPSISNKQRTICQSISLCSFSGFLMGSTSPLINDAMNEDDLGLSPYTTFFFFSLAILITTFPMCYIFSKKPLIGDPFEPSKEYFHGGWKWHFFAFASGTMWAAGTLFNYMVMFKGVKTEFVPIEQTAPLVAALWGLFLWKEFKNPKWMVVLLLGSTFVLYGGAIALLSQS